jgi:hypothetical protein
MQTGFPKLPVQRHWQAPIQRFGAGHGPIQTRWNVGGGDMKSLKTIRQLGGFGHRVAGIHGRNVGVSNIRIGCKLADQPRLCRLPGTAKQPIHKTQRPHVFTAKGFFFRHVEVFNSFHCHRRNIHRDDPVRRDRPVFERIDAEPGLSKITLVKSAGVDDQQAAFAKARQLNLEGGWIHRHQHIKVITRRHNPARTKIDLERRHAECGADRRANLGRKVRERR